MKYLKRGLFVIAFSGMTYSTAIASDFSLQGLRFFFTPGERNPEPIAPPVSIEAHPAVVRKKVNPRRTPKPIHFIGTIRSQNKYRLFWRLGDERYLSTVPEMQDKRQSNGSAKSKTTIGQDKE